MEEPAVFVNPAARRGRGGGRASAALEALRAAGPVRVIETASAGDVRERAGHLVAEGTARIVVVGGDGLVHQVLQAVGGSSTTLGIIPVGTGNDFAAALQLPRQPAEAASVALGPARRIDLLRSEAGWAASVATVGFSAEVNVRAEELRWPRGAARYSVATMLELPSLEIGELQLTFEGGEANSSQSVQAALVAVGNTALFGGGMRICPDADPGDGLLDVTIVEAVGRLDLLRHFARVFRGTHVRHPAVSVVRAAAVTLIDPAGARAVRADGEAWGTLPLRIEAVAGALSVAAPYPARPGS